MTLRRSCLRNVVTLFHYIEKEREWRKANGRPAGFETLDARKPIGEFGNCAVRVTQRLTAGAVAVGATEPLAEHMMVADFFRKLDCKSWEDNGEIRKRLMRSRWSGWSGWDSQQRKSFCVLHELFESSPS